MPVTQQQQNDNEEGQREKVWKEGKVHSAPCILGCWIWPQRGPSEMQIYQFGDRLQVHRRESVPKPIDENRKFPPPLESTRPRGAPLRTRNVSSTDHPEKLSPADRKVDSACSAR